MRRLTRLILAVAVGVVTTAASSAAGSVRTLHVDDPMDAQDPTPSLQPRPVAPDITVVDAAYDDAGAVSLTVTFANEHDMPPLVEVAFGCAGTPVFTARIIRERSLSDDDLNPGWDDQGTGRLAGFDGGVYSVQHADEGSRTIRAAFMHAQLTGHGYRCVRAAWDESDYYGAREDLAAGWFAGFEPMSVSRSSAEARTREALTQQLGARYSAAGYQYVRCPKQQLSAGEADPTEVGTTPEPATALCQFYLRSSRKVTTGGLTLAADDQTRMLTAKTYRPITYTRKWKSCRVPGYPGRLRTNEPCGGPRLLAGDIVSDSNRRFPRPLPRRFSVYAHGTNTAGHEPLVRYRCHSRHQTVTAGEHPVRRTSVTCANAVGEQLRLSFSSA